MRVRSMFKVAAVAIAAAAVSSTAVHAAPSVLAQGNLQVLGFLIQNTDGTTVSASQFDSLFARNTADLTATLNGSTATTSGSSTLATPIDLAKQVKGADIFVENDFSLRSPPPTATYVRADSQLTGSSIDFGAGATGANAQLVTEGSIIENGDGTATGNLGLTAEFNFSLSSDQKLVFAFDALGKLLANVTDVTPAYDREASASWKWALTITDSAGNRVFDWTPNGTVDPITGGTEIADGCALNDTITRLSNGTTTRSCDTTLVAGPGFKAETIILDGDTDYTLSIRHTAETDVTLIPEPSSLALIGIALAALGFSARRRTS